MTSADDTELTAEELDAIAWDFFRSEFAERTYSIWPIDRPSTHSCAITISMT